MPTSNVQLVTIARLALAAAIKGALGLLFLVVMSVLQMTGVHFNPFGTMNDVANAVLAVLGATLAWTIFSRFRDHLGPVHSLLLLLAAIGALMAVYGSFLVISGKTGFILAGLYSAAGFALVGLWLAALSLTLRQATLLPDSLTTFGIVSGVLMALALGALPSLARGADSFGAIPPLQFGLWAAGSLAWLILQPLWYYLLARVMLRP